MKANRSKQVQMGRIADKQAFNKADYRGHQRKKMAYKDNLGRPIRTASYKNGGPSWLTK